MFYINIVNYLNGETTEMNKETNQATFHVGQGVKSCGLWDSYRTCVWNSSLSTIWTVKLHWEENKETNQAICPVDQRVKSCGLWIAIVQVYETLLNY